MELQREQMPSSDVLDGAEVEHGCDAVVLRSLIVHSRGTALVVPWMAAMSAVARTLNSCLSSAIDVKAAMCLRTLPIFENWDSQERDEPRMLGQQVVIELNTY